MTKLSLQVHELEVHALAGAAKSIDHNSMLDQRQDRWLVGAEESSLVVTVTPLAVLKYHTTEDVQQFLFELRVRSIGLHETSIYPKTRKKARRRPARER